MQGDEPMKDGHDKATHQKGVLKCKKCPYSSDDIDEFADHMADEHLDVSFFRCQNCQDDIHNQCPCPCPCRCDA